MKTFCLNKTFNAFLFISLYFCLFLFIFSLVIKAEGHCNCLEDRVLKLQYPYLRGEDVAILQQELQGMGYYQAPIDGIYGLLTAEAVAFFQESNQVKVNGIMDQVSWDLLGLVSNPLPANYDSPDPEGKLSIVINLYNRVLTLYEDDKPFKIFPVAVGKNDSPSPVGEWVIKNKYERIDGGVLGSRWMGLDVPWGVYGIHGTNKPWQIGTAASLGCIRMHNRHIETIFDWVNTGTPVEIVGKREKVTIDQTLKIGQQGHQVMELQIYLKKKGLYRGRLDARYGKEMEAVIREIEKTYGLYDNGDADPNVLAILGIEE